MGCRILRYSTNTLSQTSVLISVAYCFLNLTCFGRILDQSSDSAYLEILRCAIFIIGDIIMCQVGFYGEKGTRPVFMCGLNFLYAASIGVWLTELARRTVVLEKKE